MSEQRIAAEPAQRGLGVYVLMFMASLSASCRIAPAETRWVEAHGGALMSTLAASFRGVIGVGIQSEVRQFPGVYADPWPTQWAGPAQSIAATLDGEYALAQGGEIVKLVQGQVSSWRSAGPGKLQVSSIHGGISNELYGISAGRPYRLTRSGERALPCQGPARQLATLDADVYVLNEDGSVHRTRGERCEAVPLPRPAQGITVNRRALYFVSDGAAYERRSEQVVRLPDPLISRVSGRHSSQLKGLSASERVVWGLGTEGNVFQLVYP